MSDGEIAVWIAEHFGTGADALAVLECVMEGGFYQVADWRLRLALVAFAVDVGRPAAVRVFQQVLGTEITGVLAPSDIWTLTTRRADRVREQLLSAVLQHYAEPHTDHGRRMVRVALVLEAC